MGLATNRNVRSSEVTQDLNLREIIDYYSTYGVAISAESALRIIDVFKCVKILAETVLTLPLDVFERTNKGKEKAVNYKLFELLKYEPHPLWTPALFKEKFVVDLVLEGNFYAQKIFDRKGYLSSIKPLNPRKMRVAIENGERVYYYSVEELKEKKYSSVDIFHVPGFNYDGVKGQSYISYSIDALEFNKSIRDYALNFNKNNGRPSGVLETDGSLEPDAAKRLRDGWNKAHGGTKNAGKTAVLEFGLKYKPISVSPADAQLIEMLKLTRADIASIFKVPLHLLNDMDRSTFNNVEFMDLSYAKHTILPVLTRFEDQGNKDLIHKEDRKKYYVEFNLDKLLQADSYTRAKVYHLYRQNGILSANEIRRKENKNDYEGGNQYLANGNMIDVTKMISDLEGGDNNE